MKAPKSEPRMVRLLDREPTATSHKSLDGRFEIESDVPIPEGRARVRRYHIEELEVGESFFVPNRKSLSNLGKEAKRLGREFTKRQVNGGMRIWRTK